MTELLTPELMQAFKNASTKDQVRIKLKLHTLIEKQLKQKRRPWYIWPAGNRVDLALEAINAMRDSDLLFTKGVDGTKKLLSVDIVLKISPLPAGKLDKSTSIVVQSVFQRLSERFGDGKITIHDRNQVLSGVRHTKGFGLVFQDTNHFLEAVAHTEELLRHRLAEQPAQFSPSASSSDEQPAADS